VVRRNLIGVWLGVFGLVMVAFVYLFNDSLPFGFGLLWNPRLIPAINLCRYFLCAIAIWEKQNITRELEIARVAGSLGTICRKTGLTEAAAKTAVHRLKGQLRDIVTGHLRETVANEEDLEVELAEFLALLR